MAAKVTARHQICDLLQEVEQLRNDPNHRVRAAAERAGRRIVAAEA